MKNRTRMPMVMAWALLCVACGDVHDTSDEILMLDESQTTVERTAQNVGQQAEVTVNALNQDSSEGASSNGALRIGKADDTRPTETGPEVESLKLDLRDYQDNQLAFLKTRGSLDPNEDVVFYWTGSIFLDKPRDPFAPATRSFPGPIMQFEGFNIARFTPVAGGVRMLSREVSVYKNMSGRIIDCWNNRALGLDSAENVPVVHVFNDPVNHTIRGGTAKVFGDNVTWPLEVILRYPSPLPVDDYRQFSAGNTYESAELFNFYTKMSDLNDPTLPSAPVTISWSRVGQLLPWMKGAQTEARLIYHTHGYKLLGGFDQLPEDIKAFVDERAPEYRRAPESDESPNQTSWRVFKSMFDSAAYEARCR